MYPKLLSKHLACAMAIAVLGTALIPSPSIALLTGEAEIGYNKYDLTAGGVKQIDSHSFQQRYSLLYSQSSLLTGGRLGYYDVSLGYEWASFSTRIKTPDSDTNSSISSGHVLYNGEVLIDPAELPMRFRAYSYDLSRISFVTDTATPVSGRDQIIKPGLATNMIDGTHISSGATLTFGVKDGMANGYNQIFRYIPMVLLDYRDQINRDLKSETPVDTRLQQLAFVSLNKRDNWFHVRSTRYDDFINKDQWYRENQVQIGTVDQNLTRRWVDFSNWIKLSADGQFSKRSGEIETNKFQEYDLNLFGIATRQKWEGRSFTNFNRRLDTTGLTLERTIPLYLNGIYGDDTDWKVRLVSKDKDKKYSVGGGRDTEQDDAFSIRVNSLKRSKFTLSGTLSAENIDSSISGKTLALEAGVETSSTRRFSDTYGLFASYNIRHFSSTTSKGDTSYLNHNAVGRVTYSPLRTLRLDFEENVQAANGTNPQSFGNEVIQLNSGFSGQTTNDIFARRDPTLNGYVRSITTATASWTPIARFRTLLSFSEDILSQPEVSNDYLSVVRNTVEYSLGSFSLRLDNRVNYQNVSDGSRSYYESYGNASYRPTRNLDAALNYRYNYAKLPSEATTYLDLRQNLNYYFFRTNGMARRLVELMEEFSYNESDSTLSTTTNITKRILLGTRYYPYSRILVGGTIGYSWTDPGSYSDIVYSGTVGLDFRALQASLDYSHGKRTGGDNRTENRLSANMRKIF